jgi:hypothetical protein
MIVADASDLRLAAEKVCEALRIHADVCARNPEDVGAVIRAGEALVRAVVEHERVLGATAGWSSPIRHLGPLPIFDTAGDRQMLEPTINTASTEGPQRVRLTARYDVVVDRDELVAFVHARFGHDLASWEAALRWLYEAESWDPQRYPAAVVRAEAANVRTEVL